jgi:hypothetical protein
VTGTDIDNRIDAFWAWIQYNATPLRLAALAADRERDTDLLDAVSGIYEQIAKISDELVVDLHVDPASSPSPYAALSQIFELADAWRHAASS